MDTISCVMMVSNVDVVVAVVDDVDADVVVVVVAVVVVTIYANTRSIARNNGCAHH
jgi:hypothetical protein